MPENSSDSAALFKGRYLTEKVACDNLREVIERCAMQYHKNAIKIYRKTGDRDGESIFTWNLGLIYEKLGN